MKKDKKISLSIEEIEKQISEQIAYHEAKIEGLKFTLKMWKETAIPQPIEWIKINAPLTRDLIRRFLKNYKQEIRNVDIIEMLYKGLDEKEKSKLVKTLSVILSQMAEKEEITIEKRKHVKGNFYKWKE